MVRRFIQSADIEIDELTGALLVAGESASAITSGQKTGTAGVAVALVAASTPCRFVWVGARVDSNGNALNTKPVFVGGSGGQYIPVMPNGVEGMVIQIDDAVKLYIKPGVTGQGVSYAVFA